MIGFEEARKQVLARAPILGAERVRLLEGLGRVLANAVTASRDVPHEDNSAMDGYAVRHEDVIGASTECPARLKVSANLWPGDRMRIEWAPAKLFGS